MTDLNTLLLDQDTQGLLPNSDSALLGEGNTPAGGDRYKRTLVFSLRAPIIFGSAWLCRARSASCHTSLPDQRAR